jgi:hypothetical protein
MEVRHQVFVSSTFSDLKDERLAIIQALLELDCIPAGMELFAAADDDQWTIIKKVIDDCDYYIVVVGGRYGSVFPSGKSYTEMEYEYALSTGKPIIGFLHKNPGLIPASKTESSEHGRRQLENFRELVKQKTCGYWTTAHDLASAVSTSLVKLKRNRPSSGWVRADQQLRLASQDGSSHEIKKLRALGIKHIHLKRGEIDFVDFIAKTKPTNEIRMLGITMRDLQSHEARSAIERKLNSGCNVKLMLLHRNSRFVKERANDEIRGTHKWRTWTSWRTELIEFDELHQRYIAELPSKLQRKIKLAHFDAVPTFSLFMNGKTTIVGFYLSGKLGVASPYIELDSTRGSLHTVFENYFNYLWANRK